MELRLRPPHADDEAAARAAHAELAVEGFIFLLDAEDLGWEEWLGECERSRRGELRRPDRVPATFLFAEVAGKLVGRASVRHALNPWLRRYGGHIGYSVRPAFRRRGYATEILRQSLIIARAVGVQAALITCDEDNAGSIAVIERCGGVLEDTVAGETPGAKPRRRYWID